MNLAGILTGVRFTIRHPDTDKPLSFGKVYTYEDNSLIPKDTWKDENKKAINTNPIILDASGQCDLFLDGVYRIVVKDNNDLIINTIDRVRDGATVAREFAEELINGYAQLNLDPTILNPVAENTVNIVAIGENIDSVVTDALNIEAIKTNALNINSINTNATNITTIQTASANAIIAEQQAQIATTKASESLLNANNALTYRNEAEIFKTNAKSSEINADLRATAASTSEINAKSSEVLALQYKNTTLSLKEETLLLKDETVSNATIATQQANISTTKASESSISATNASDSENLAYRWANEAEDVVVANGEHSAYHWAEKAQKSISGSLSAKNISYVNTTSGLLAINIQDAIDEVVATTGTSLNNHIADTTNPHQVTKAQVGLDLADNTPDNAKNVLSATKLQTARLIGGVSFDGTANIDLAGVNIAGNQNTSGNAATATKLQTARLIAGTSFDGSANINITFANISTKPTTISGYGITDAYTKTEVGTLAEFTTNLG